MRSIIIAVAVTVLLIAAQAAAAGEGDPLRVLKPADLPADGLLPAASIVHGWAVALDGVTLAVAPGANGDKEFFADAADRRVIRLRLWGVMVPAPEATAAALFARAALDDLLTCRQKPCRTGSVEVGGFVKCTAEGILVAGLPAASCRTDVVGSLSTPLVLSGAVVTDRDVIVDGGRDGSAMISGEKAPRLAQEGFWSGLPRAPVAGVTN
ncbi:hypothetical protein SAMN06265365_108169 [Tistlia consotensis]|uniref:Uncharacterized protein n=1 Tax=Tistlia consotensis USBA 355 TaxID=560819 RepID=A0A1Y6BQ87_9PROT|nr:hypothetical protein [Tistlia consotensis]SMF23443.1 hypothetical protein SAMN05428998_10811 [Tistlia consotensis USBA 355]SNR61640.1 hypothetical protein SAMN06265365_108169 [Tistlia consotensis]